MRTTNRQIVHDTLGMGADSLQRSPHLLAFHLVGRIDQYWQKTPRIRVRILLSLISAQSVRAWRSRSWFPTPEPGWSAIRSRC